MKVDFELGPRAEHSNDLVAAVADYFDLGRVDECKDLGGTYNLNLRVHTSSGAYVIRVHRPWVGPERVDCLHQIKQELIDQGFPIPRQFGWVSCDQIGLGANRLIELEEYVHFEGVTDTWERYREAFSTLGRLHQALARLPNRIKFVPPIVHNYGLPGDLLNLLVQTIEELQGRVPVDGAQEALEICGVTRELLRSIQGWWEGGGRDLPHHLVHGDFGGENLLWSRNRILALLDFDMVDIHERVYELAYCLYWMFIRLDGEADPARWSWPRLGEMLASYQAAGGELSDEERRSLPIEMGRVPLCWIATAGFEPNPSQAILERAQSVEISRWLITHAGDL